MAVPDVPLPAIYAAATATGLALLAGLPLAWLLGRHQFRGKSPLQALLLVPMVLPATLLGYCAVTLGQQARGARVFRLVGLEARLDLNMAVVVATIAALAMVVWAAQTEFAKVDRRLEQAARTLGRSEWSLFWSVTLPLSWRGVVAGGVLAFARALGEVALTLVVARVGAVASTATTLGLLAVTVAVVLTLSITRLTRTAG